MVLILCILNQFIGAHIEQAASTHAWKGAHLGEVPVFVHLTTKGFQVNGRPLTSFFVSNCNYHMQPPLNASPLS